MRLYAYLKEPLERDSKIDERGWIRLDDPLPDCLQDAFIPLRVKGRDTGTPHWGTYESLLDGEWAEYHPQS